MWQCWQLRWGTYVLNMIAIITLFFAALAAFFRLKYAIALFIIINIIAFIYLGFGPGSQAGGWYIMLVQIPALIPSVIGIFFGQMFQGTVENKLKILIGCKSSDSDFDKSGKSQKNKLDKSE